MKKLILATSALVLIGGAAAAQDISVSAEASATYGNWETAPGTVAAFSFATELTFDLEGSAGGYTYGGSLTIEDGGVVDQGVFWMAAGFGTVSLGKDEFDELNADDTPATYDTVSGDSDDSDYGDWKYEGTFGALGVTVVGDAGAGTTPGTGIALGEPNWWAEFTYSSGSVSVGLETDATSAWEVSASADVGGATVGGAFDDTSAWDVFVSASLGAVNVKVTADDGAVYGIELDGKAGDLSWAAATNTDSDTSASVKYSMNDLSIGLEYDNDDAGSAIGPVDPAGLLAGGLGVADRGDEADVILTLGYGMGNLAFEVLVNGVDEHEISMTATFEW